MRTAAALALLILAAPAASAHTRGTSYSEWTLTATGAEVQARVSELELTRLGLYPQLAPDYAERAGRALVSALELRANGTPCAPGPAAVRVARDGWVHASWSARCAGGGARAIRSTLLIDVAPGHLHFARVQMPGGEVRERVLTAAAPTLELPAVEPGNLVHYVGLGVGHILSGWDHLAFVLALLLLAASFREMVLVATGFTLAHSLTLGAAVLGLVQAHGERVEAVIGFTIALVAVERLWLVARRRWMPLALVALLAVAALRAPPMLVAGLALFTACYFALMAPVGAASAATAAAKAAPAKLRLAMAALFGLVHGFGFAGALVPLRLPAERVATALFGFNTGVELGQLLVIALTWPLLLAARRAPAAGLAQGGAAAGLCALGVYWFLVRTFV